MKIKPLSISGMADFSVTITPDAEKQKEDALTLAKSITVVTTADQQQDAIASASLMKSLTKAIETTRKEIKQPILEAGRAIDTAADNYSKALDIEIERVQKLAGAYQAEQNRIAAETRAAEERRQQAQREAEEAAMQAELEEAKERQRQADAARLADLERIQSATDEAEKAEAQRLADIAAEQRARQEAEQAAHLKEIQEARMEEERQRTYKLAEIAPQKAQGASVRVQMDYEVIDIHALYKARPDLVTVEPKRAMILANLSIPNHAPIDGIREIETTKLSAKA